MRVESEEWRVELEMRERTIKGMECCAVGAECDHCPYSPMNKSWFEGCYQMHADALALLKAQEPRVMTLEEVLSLNRGDYVCLEDIDKSEVLSGLFDEAWAYSECITFVLITKTIDVFSNEYNVRWRCWTSRPTDEQREAVKWE